jgi:hypothetical protein
MVKLDGLLFQRIACLSTVHVPPEEFEFLKSCTDAEYLVWDEKFDQGYGLWLYIGDVECKYCGGGCELDEDNQCDGYTGDVDGLYDHDEHLAVSAIIRWAARNDIRYVRLTRDGETVEDLPKFEWS